MSGSSTRRNLLGHAGGFLGVVGLAAQSRGATMQKRGQHQTAEEGEDYYRKLGVTKIINAAGTYTALTASVMPPQVQAAVALSAKHPVRLHDLQTKAGEYLAQRLHCEAAMVTAGASSALTLGTAACIGVMNKSPIEAVPSKVGGLGKNEVIIRAQFQLLL